MAKNSKSGCLYYFLMFLYWIYIGWWWRPIKWLVNRKREEKSQKEFYRTYNQSEELLSSTSKSEPVDTKMPIRTSPTIPQCLTTPSKIKWEKINDRDHHLIESIQKYTVVDVETTGLDRVNDRIVEIGILQVENGEIVGKHSTMINPGIHIKEDASKVNGIYDKDVEKAPNYQAVAPIVADLLLGQTIIGHNVDFDRAFVGNLLDTIEAEGTIKYIDTLAFSRNVLKELPADQRPENYKLQTLAKYFDVSIGDAHRALADTITTHMVFEKCKEAARKQAEWKALERKEQRRREKEAWNTKFEKSPLLNKNIVYTGSFTLEREQMKNLARSVGAIPRDEVNGNTDYLVVGYIDNLPEWAYERKKGKADDLAKNGKKVKQISESEYLTLIGDAKNVLSLK